VGGLSWQTTEESLRWHFEQYGPVASVEVMRDRATGDPRGFAFVVFADAATVDLVMNEARHEINHKIVDVKRAQARGVAPPSIHNGGKGGGGGDDGDDDDAATTTSSTTGGGSSRMQHRPSTFVQGGGGSGGGGDGMTPEVLGNKVFVGGIPPHVDKDGLKTFFEQFGPVTDSIIMIDQNTNRSRCFGFVTFENGSEGAQKAIEAQPVRIDNRNVEVKLATPKGGDGKRQAPANMTSKHVGLRAGMSAITSTGPYAGLAVSYGRSGWRAGYGTKAFGKAGWAIEGWDDGGFAPEKSGFSFDMLRPPPQGSSKSHSKESSRHQKRDRPREGGGGGGGGRSKRSKH